ncbi:hypothetical protein Vadar_002759 [Vaccinium darrowii]|uniref:Uncharacterized protein n=1 Tax=Vaccinium darrowii TaxID=229202 RepID=A0ACB7WXK4_9ERIC|nr:hypothetical protein Vadar_002759 [Vaccinium darrowii]
MTRIALIGILIISLVVTIPWIQSLEDEPNQVNWAQRLDGEKGVVTNLQFYFHDTVTGQNPTAVRVAQASDTSTSLTLFGALMMVDDPLTESPDPSSKLVGRAQGLYGSAAQSDFGLIMVLNYGFTDGIYNGSSFSVLGLNQAMHQVREMAIVGGTGLFRMARGYASAKTYYMNPLTGNAIVGYNVTLFT